MGVQYIYSIVNWQSILFFALVLLLIWLYKTTQLPDGFPNGPRPLPVLGNLLILAKDPQKGHKSLAELSKDYGPIVGLKLGSIPTVLLNSLDSVKEFLVKHGDCFSARPQYMHMLSTIMRKPKDGPVRGVSWSNGDKWKQTRRFALSTMRDFGVGKRSIETKIQEEAAAMCEELHLVAGQSYSPDMLMQESVSNIICSVCFGTRFEYTDQDFQKLMELMRYNFQSGIATSIINFIPALRLLPMPQWYHNVLENMHEGDKWLEKQIALHRANYDPNDIRDFVDLYLSKEDEETHEIFCPDSMTRLVLDLFSTGTETTSTGLRWFLLFIVNYMAIQKKLQKEIDTIIGSARLARLEDRQNMPYMEAVIHETLRFGNIASIGVPHTAERDVTVMGYRIPKDTLIMPNLYAVHMDKSLWNDPEQFIPERWIDEEGKFQKKEGFIAFSVGPRSCMGESMAKSEMFVFATTILQRFNVKPVDPQKPPPIEGTLGFSHSPVKFEIIFETR